MNPLPDECGRVLLIDDDEAPMKSYIGALERCGLTVHQVRTPDGAIDFMNRDTGDVRLILLDIMMPPGAAYELDDTNDGTITGLLLHDRIRKRYPDVPILVLTNVTAQKLLDRLQQGPKLQVAQKASFRPSELARRVQSMVQSVCVAATKH
jgi:CheY-like chemotaxis protein